MADRVSYGLGGVERSIILRMAPLRFSVADSTSGVPSLSGAGTLTGVVFVGGVPAARTVEVWDGVFGTDLLPMYFAASTVSDPVTGAWSIAGLTTTRPLRVIVRGVGLERDVTRRNQFAT